MTVVINHSLQQREMTAMGEYFDRKAGDGDGAQAMSVISADRRIRWSPLRCPHLPRPQIPNPNPRNAPRSLLFARAPTKPDWRHGRRAERLRRVPSAFTERLRLQAIGWRRRPGEDTDVGSCCGEG